MGITFSSVLISVLESLLILAGIRFVLFSPSLAARVHPTLIFRLFVLAWFRLLFPYNWIGMTIAPRAFDLWLADFVCIPVLGWPLHSWLSLLWLMGVCLSISAWHRKEKLAHLYLHQAESQGIRRSIADYIPDWCGPDYPVHIASVFSSPMVIAQGQAILLPHDHYDASTMEYILRHEAEHLYNHDGSLIHAFNLIKAIYWWLPLFQWIQPVFVLFTESRVDYQVISTCSRKQALEYCESLLTVARQKVPLCQPVVAMHMVPVTPTSDDLLSLRLRIVVARLEEADSSIQLDYAPWNRVLLSCLLFAEIIL